MDDRNDKIGNIEYQSLLYDFYGSLLGDSQREVMDLYHEDDMSLTEIAEELGQSRQGVHYTLKKAEAALERYEEKLGLVRGLADKARLSDEAGRIIRELIDSGKLGDSGVQMVGRLAEIIRSLSE